MTPEELEYFRNLLRAMLEEAQRKGDSTLEELTDGEAAFADPADRATAESDRSFTLRIRDRERRLIHKIQEAIKRMDDGVYGVCEECGEDIGVARHHPVRFVQSAARGGGRRTGQLAPVSRVLWTLICSDASATP